jgi:TrwC relaxase
MLTISKPLSAGQAQTYHAEEFANARENYYTEADQIRGEWHGRLAEQWGLHGQVREEYFQRLSEGQQPITGEQLIRQPFGAYEVRVTHPYVPCKGATDLRPRRTVWQANFRLRILRNGLHPPEACHY